MRVPNKVKIGPFKYTIKYEKNEDFTNKLYGDSSATDHVIRISPDMTLDREQVIVIHELLHMVLELVRVPGVGRDQEEHLCTHAAPIIYQVLQDNPALTKYLTKKGK